MAWKPTEFDVYCSVVPGAEYDALVRFASPVDTGDAINDLVAMEWYAPRDQQQQVLPGPAVVVLHESDPGMHVGRIMARSLRTKGIHAFLLQLPHYGLRNSGQSRVDASRFLVRMRQGVADARRARDAIAVLPNIKTDRIAIQGTSLGGFVASLSASLDNAFAGTYLVLSGGDLHSMLLNGKKDSAAIRQRLAAAGFTGEKLKELLWNAEPLRIAHRMDPQRTWLYSAIDDSVVPIHNANLLARRVSLDDEHHVVMSGNHYTAAIHLPFVISHIAAGINREDDL